MNEKTEKKVKEDIKEDLKKLLKEIDKMTVKEVTDRMLGILFDIISTEEGWDYLLV